jgi:site-specific DNA-methyltransferase (adenine-specific)
MMEPEWKNYPKNMGNNLHSLCSYMAMFPPSIPHYFIQKYSKEGDVVLDPFSGRGTTSLEACTQGRIGIGNDKNQLAYVLTFAKTNVPQRGRILSRLKDLEANYNPSAVSIDQVEWQIKMIFSDYTLKQLVYLREKLNWRTSNVDAFIAAMILGIMHGNSECYLSLKMPNTFSMSPNYVRGFIQAHRLERPVRDTFTLLVKKLDRCYQRPTTKGKAYNQDARHLHWIKNESVNLIVTSPPYTRVIRYGAFNWIRLWFLKQNAKEVDSQLLCTQSLPKYLDFMTEVLIEIQRVLKPEGVAVLVIGDVRDKYSDLEVNLASHVLKSCAKPLAFKRLEEIREDVIREDTKVSKIWGKKKRGQATKIDRILVLKKS